MRVVTVWQNFVLKGTYHRDSIRTVHSEMFDVFIMRVVVKMSVAPTDSSPIVSVITRSPPCQTRAFAQESYLNLWSVFREGVGYVKTQLSCILLYYADDDMFRLLWAIFRSQKCI